MQMPLQITVRNMPHFKGLDMYIRDQTRKLEECFSPIISCHVVVDVPQGQQINVRIDLSVPRQEIFVNLDHHQDVYVALRDAFDAARRLLEEYAHRQGVRPQHILNMDSIGYRKAARPVLWHKHP